MKHLYKILAISICVLAGTNLHAQEYAKYRPKKAKDTIYAKEEKTPVNKEQAVMQPPETEKEVAVSQPSGNFQAIMNKAGEQAVQHNYKEALKFYAEALEVSNKDEAWRVFVSRASAYTQMNDYKNAMKEYGLMIDDGNAPQKKLAYAYLMRANLAAETRTKKDDAQACDDLKKARELGITDIIIKNQPAVVLNCE